jgi:hypothetical protein
MPSYSAWVVLLRCGGSSVLRVAGKAQGGVVWSWWESLAMTPPASVSGLYMSHPEAEYFGVGRIERDQVADYAARKGWPLAEAEKWLSPILAYEPASRAKAAA